MKQNLGVQLSSAVCSLLTAAHIVTFLFLRVENGECPTYVPIDDFDADRYTGLWYELQRDYNFVQSKGECTTAEYLRYAPGGFTVENIQYVNNGKKDALGYIQASKLFPGKIAVSFTGYYGLYNEYRIIDTDYTSYAIVDCCG